VSFPAYPSYRHSGVDWLGDIPANWSVVRLKDIAEIINGYPFDSKGFDPEHGRPLVRIRDLGASEAEVRYNGEGVKGFDVTSRDVLIGMDGDFNVGRWKGSEPALLNQRVCALRTASPVLSTLLEHAMVAPLRRINALTYATTVKHLSSYQIGSTRLAWPSDDDELSKIAAFLDRETAKIDALVAEQRKLIELLKEKRQAVISNTVTKGLDPAVPMKDSGVEWLGDVPAHWEVKPLKWLTPDDRAIMYGIVLPGPDVGSGIPIVKGGDVKEHRLSLSTLCYTTSEIEAPFARARLRPDDIVYSIRGSIGDAELVPIELLDANITQDVARISPCEGVSPHWLLQVMRSKPVFVQLEQRSLGAAVRGINIFDLKRACIPAPPPKEQLAIATELAAQLGRLSQLEQAAAMSIELMQEHRAALISAAVTGKIDVRNAPPQQAEAA
jgi:type I restriction enzyme S subunit